MRFRIVVNNDTENASQYFDAQSVIEAIVTARLAPDSKVGYELDVYSEIHNCWFTLAMYKQEM